MKNSLSLFLSFLLFSPLFFASLFLPLTPSFSQDLDPQPMPFHVYKDASSSENHYIPSGWMGDHKDIEMNLNCRTTPYEGAACIKFTYKATGSQGENWAGIYFLHPTDNWGMLDGGYNLSKAAKLLFYARGEKGTEVISEFKAGGINGGKYTDSASASIFNIALTQDWKQYTIDLQGQDLSRIIGGFCWSADKERNPNGMTFYLDDIRYE